jgi:hypothetical protein
MATYAAYASASSGSALENEEMRACAVGYTAIGNGFSMPHGNISFNVSEQKIVISFARGFTGEARAEFTFGAQTLTASAEVGSKDISVPVYRLKPGEQIILTLVENGQESEYSFYVFDVIEAAADTGSSEYLRLYGAYLESLAK